MKTNATIVFAATIFALVIASVAHAYPSVSVSTPYYSTPDTHTTVLYNPYTGNTYIHGSSNNYDAYANGYYDGKYNRNPNFCRYDWFDRCKFDPDDAYKYYYSQCAKYDPSDDQWYDRGCDYYFGRYRPGSYGGQFDHYQYDYPSNRHYSNYGYGDYYTAGYPRMYVHYVNDYTYNGRYYDTWW